MNGNKLDICWVSFFRSLSGDFEKKGLFTLTEYDAHVEFIKKGSNNGLLHYNQMHRAKDMMFASRYNLKCTRCSIGGSVKLLNKFQHMRGKYPHPIKMTYDSPVFRSGAPTRNGCVIPQPVINSWISRFRNGSDRFNQLSDEKYNCSFVPCYIECHLDKTQDNLKKLECIEATRNNMFWVELLSKNAWYASAHDKPAGSFYSYINYMDIKYLDDEVVVYVIFDLHTCIKIGSLPAPGMVFAPYLPATVNVVSTPKTMGAPLGILHYMDFAVSAPPPLLSPPPSLVPVQDTTPADIIWPLKFKQKANKWKDIVIQFNDKATKKFKEYENRKNGRMHCIRNYNKQKRHK